MYHQECAGPFRTSTPLILASGSPRRRQLFQALGLDFRVEVSRVEEPAATLRDRPVEYACTNARLKAMDVAGRYPGSAVLGADTIVVLNGRILGKPSDQRHAIEMLSQLSGVRHEVITACCLVVTGQTGTVGSEQVFYASSHVYMGELSPEVIKAYVASGEPLDKAGSYAVQGAGAFMVQRIEGSWTNVVGLPMERVVHALLDRQIIMVRKVE